MDLVLLRSKEIIIILFCTFYKQSGTSHLYQAKMHLHYFTNNVNGMFRLIIRILKSQAIIQIRQRVA